LSGSVRPLVTSTGMKRADTWKIHNCAAAVGAGGHPARQNIPR
jgi:hypothetical protein